MSSRVRPTGWRDRALLTLRTASYLRPTQIAHRLARGLRSGPWQAPPHEWRHPARPWETPARMPLALQDDGSWRFLDESRAVREPRDWNDPAAARLWRYHLHYFDDLRSREAHVSAEQLDEWMARWRRENPPPVGTGWEPYPLSRRIVNWAIWHLARNMPAREAVDSIGAQATRLSGLVELDLGANHLFANAKALVFAGSVLEGPSSAGWLRTGLNLLDTQLAEQVLADGGHYERSPMYHAVILEDLLDLVQLAASFPGIASLNERASAWRATASAMTRFLDGVTHPDGEIAFFNDAAFGMAPAPTRLFSYAQVLGVGWQRAEGTLDAFPHTGYYRARCGGFCVIFDAAPVGPDDQPGHAHADTLSFELSIEGERLIVNSGTSTYAPGADRHFERSTAAHTTVEVDDEDSSEVWSAFRVARRARPVNVKVTQSGRAIHLEGAHDGYRRLRGAPVHHRSLEVDDASVRVIDTISGRGVHRAVGRFGLHPLMRIERRSPSAFTLQTHSGVKIDVEAEDGSPLAIEEGSYAERFGSSSPRPVIRWDRHGELPARVAICVRARR